MVLAADDIADLRRWAICGAVIVLAHGGLAAGIVNWGEPIEGTGAAAGIVIEFAPLPIAPATLRADVRPGPEQDTVDAPAVKPVESLEEKQKVEETREAKLDSKIEEKVDTKPVEEPPAEVKPAPNPEVAVQPPPPQEVKQETPAPRQESPALVATAPEVVAKREAAIMAAPRQGARHAAPSLTVCCRGPLPALLSTSRQGAQQPPAGPLPPRRRHPRRPGRAPRLSGY